MKLFYNCWKSKEKSVLQKVSLAIAIVLGLIFSLAGQAVAAPSDATAAIANAQTAADTAFMLMSAALVCFYAVTFKAKLQFDDSLDTFPVHGVGGTVGAILTGIFATTEVNSAGKDGLLRGNFNQFIVQIVVVLIAYAIAAIGTFILMKILDITVGLRLKPEAELQGMDISGHGEEGYNEEFGE
ncbi:ammonia channel protein, partial [Chroococcidiopsis cubana CCALA 043]